MFSRRNYVQFGLVVAALVIFCPRSSAQTISCSSDDGRRHYCPTNSQGRAQLVKQRSDSPCREGYSWGSDSRGIWVDHGCRADFAIDERRGDWDRDNDRDHHRDHDRDRDQDWGGNNGSGQIISCSSDDMHRHYCPVDTRGGVKVLKRHSDSRCERGYGWGSDRRGIWVDHGCRADFQVGR